MSDDNKKNDNPMFADLLDSLTNDVSSFSEKISKTISNNIRSLNSDKKSVIDFSGDDIQKIDSDAKSTDVNYKKIQDSLEEAQRRVFSTEDKFEKNYKNLKQILENSRKNDGKHSSTGLPEIKDVSSFLQRYKQKIGDNLVKVSDNLDKKVKEAIEKHESQDQSNKVVVADVSKSTIKEDKDISVKSEENLKSKVVSDKNVVNEDQRTSASSSAPPELFESVARLLTKMSNRKVLYDQTWEDLSDMLSKIREQWVAVISSNNLSSKSSSWFKDWNDIISDISVSSENWPSPQNDIWNSWSEDRIKENNSLSSWLSQDLSDIKINDDSSFALDTPASMTGQGIYPRAPKSVPVVFVQSLSKVADFFEYLCLSKSTFSWKNTPAKICFDNFKENLENWEPTNKEDKEWKEKALDRYAVIDARIVLKLDKKVLPRENKSSKKGSSPTS